MPNPLALVFDFGGTLDAPSHWLDRFVAHYRGAGVEVDRGELDPAFDFATKAGYAAGKPIEHFGLGDLVRFLVGNQFEYLRQSGPPRIQAWLARLDSSERFKTAECIRDSFLKETLSGLAHSREILRRLKPGYKLAVVSNWYGNLESIIGEAGMGRLFDAVVDSTRCCAFKPDLAIFRAVLKPMQVEAADAAMIGDSIIKDCAPAHRLGMRTVHLRARGNETSQTPSHACSKDFTPDYEIDSLDQLLDIRW